MKKKVLVAISGGVDSSVAALLLKEQGYDVVGAHMKLWDYIEVGGDTYKDGRCCSVDSITDCRFVCDTIGAPFFVLNFSSEFREKVIENFVSEYRVGRTPNPCVKCNSDIKWEAFLRKADELGCEFIATGHYAIMEQVKSGRYGIRQGVDHTRDQSYVLWGLSQSSLSRTLMPLGGFLKSQVREIASQRGLKTASNPESREICFVADDNYHRFLTEYEEKNGRSFEPGEIIHENGQSLGHHKGTVFFTIGQRKGMGISYPTPLYVLHIDPKTNRVIVGDNDSLLQNEFIVDQINWVARESSMEPFDSDVKIRYLHQPSPAQVIPLTPSSARVIFKNKQRAITPGQSAVFYDKDVVLGGGVIAEVKSKFGNEC